MVPIDRPGKIVCVGLNYRDHAEEQGVELPKAPLFFAKYTTSLIGPGDPIVIPPRVEQCDYEAELGVVIGETVKNVSKENAFEAVAGYVVANDVSARDLQFADGQWTRGQVARHVLPGRPARAALGGSRSACAPRSAPSSPGETLQDSNTSNLIFGIDEIISYASRTVDARGRRPDPDRHARRGRRLPRPEAPAAARATPSRSRSTASARSPTR